MLSYFLGSLKPFRFMLFFCMDFYVYCCLITSFKVLYGFSWDLKIDTVIVDILFALRLAVSCSLLYSEREVWFLSTCYSRQGNPCVRAPLRSRSNLVFALHLKFSPVGVGMTPGKFCKITPKNAHFCALWKQVLDNTVFTFFYF